MHHTTHKHWALIQHGYRRNLLIFHIACSTLGFVFNWIVWCLQEIPDCAPSSLSGMTRNTTERATSRHSDEPKRDQESNCRELSLNISHQATALGEQILNHARPSLSRMTRNITERATPRHSDEPKRDQESNCHTLSLNISRKATALGEQILNHARPSLFRMTRNITERATSRHSDEPRRDQESNCHTLSLNISHQVTALGEQIMNHARPSLFRMTRNVTERATSRHSDEPRRDQESNCRTLLAQYFSSSHNTR